MEISAPKPSAISLESLGELELKSFLGNIDVILFDCDGVLWIDEELLENAEKLVILLRAIGKKIFFLTNNCTLTRAKLLEKLNGMGFEATEEEVLSSGYLTGLYLTQEEKLEGRAYVIGTTGLVEELKTFGIDCLPIGPDNIPPVKTHREFALQVLVPAGGQIESDIGAVIVGFDPFFSYMKALKAITYLTEKNSFGKEPQFIATNVDEQIPASKRLPRRLAIPGAGALVSAIKAGSGREPVVIGKPGTFPFEFLQKHYNLDPRRVLMVGDRGSSDILFGRKCNLWTLLVLSGTTSLVEVRKWEEAKGEEQKYIPHFYSKDVSEFYQLISQLPK